MIDRSGYVRARWLPEEDNSGAIPVSPKPSSKCYRESRLTRHHLTFARSTERRALIAKVESNYSSERWQTHFQTEALNGTKRVLHVPTMCLDQWYKLTIR